jgi:hypothetical protein
MKYTSPLFSLFKQSPVTPMQHHMRIVTSCAYRLPELIEAMLSNDPARIEKVGQEVFELEEKADTVKLEIRINFPKGLFMPVDRRDLLMLLNDQEKVSGITQDIASLIMIHTFSPDISFAAQLRALSDKTVETCNKALDVVESLDEVFETGFGDYDIKIVMDRIAELQTLEAETDKIGLKLAKDLCSQEATMPPIAFFFWYKLIKKIGTLADGADQVGKRVLLLLAR